MADGLKRPRRSRDIVPTDPVENMRSILRDLRAEDMNDPRPAADVLTVYEFTVGDLVYIASRLP